MSKWIEHKHVAFDEQHPKLPRKNKCLGRWTENFRVKDGVKIFCKMDRLSVNTGLVRQDTRDRLTVNSAVERHLTVNSGLKRHNKMDISWRRKGPKFPLALFTFLFLIFHHLHVSLGSCVGMRKTLLREETGSISDGNGNYPEDTECQWLIVANNSDMSICLQFSSFTTECTYDFLHIFDGSSFSSPLIGSFSGSKLPPYLCATSGKMLLYLYSDTNYNLKGFETSYTITDCPMDCLDRGTCVDHLCQCSPAYYGDFCQYETCPGDCLHGSCDHNLARAECSCQEGFIGESCSLSTKSNEGWGQTLLLSSGGDGGLSRRTGHAAVYHQPTDSMWVFGGYNLNNVLDDLLRYDFQSNTWETVNTIDDAPSGRYGHTMDLVGDNIVIFGGILSNDSFSNELWSFNIVSRRWSLLPSSLTLPATAHHSSCIVNETTLYIVGGRDRKTPFHPHIYRYDVVEQSVGWELVEPSGGLMDSIGVAEHSSVYYPGTQSIYVFGGLRENNPKFGIRTADLYVFNIPRRFWQQLTVFGAQPRERTFHTAVVIGEQYMVVYGGNAHEHADEPRNSQGHEECYENSLNLYNFECNSWVEYQKLSEDFIVTGNQHDDPGRFGHSAVVRDGTTLVVTGGFRGIVTNDVVAIKMPGTVAVNPLSAMDNVTDYCSYHKSSQHCTDDPSCGYCQSTLRCLSIDKSQNCSQFEEYSSCDGLCRQAGTCHDCLLMNGLRPEVKGHCSWCVQTSHCYPSEEVNECTAGVGWWGKSPTVITDFDLCVAQDFPPGLSLALFHEPINREYPDRVAVISADDHELDGSSGIWDVKGSLYPLDAVPSKAAPHLQFSVKSKNSNVKVWLSNTTTNRSVLIANFTSIDSGTSGVLPLEEGSSWYGVHIEGNWTSTVKPSLVGLAWNGNTIDTESIPQQHLRPYTSGNCSFSWNCQSCLTDSLCGWSASTHTCMRRNASTEAILTINAGYCLNCSSNIECTTCLQNPLCEWDKAGKDTLCVRKGSASEKEPVRELSECPAPCYLRTSCSECTQQNSCAWCAADQRCFPFKHYINSYVYGQCSHWFDSALDCPDCSLHKTCVDCLEEFQCGWCGNNANPLLGVCTQGDFGGGREIESCSRLVAGEYNVTGEATWSYEMCPTVDDCKLGVYNCHPNASCKDTISSYDCKCKQGFRGDGVNSCERTCFYECENGRCSEYPNYECICDLGWTGDNCSTDCGCNQHSTCSNGAGLCDQCHNSTMGEHCDECTPGSYGDPQSPEGCQPCRCNGHGDPEAGFCNATSLQCYCVNNTMGTHCQSCAPNFYGDPSDGRHCYLKCAGRTVLWNTTKVSVGSFEGEGFSEQSRTSCLWILSSFADLEGARTSLEGARASLEGARASLNENQIIQLTIDTINTTCGRDYVQVYDGVPEHLTGWSDFPGKLLGNFCGYGNTEPLTVMASSGFVTMSFQASLQGRSINTGFTAHYEMLDCTTGCGQNRSCVDNQCVCDQTHQGPRCDQNVCPSNCHEDNNQGRCDRVAQICNCSESYGGSSCSYRVSDTDSLKQGVWTPLYHQSSGVLTGRVGHSMFRRSDGNLVVFGGFSDDGSFLNDMWSYNPADGTWTEVTYQNPSPSGRYFHASVYLSSEDQLLVSGGFTEAGISGEFWIFHTDTSLWTLVEMDAEDPEVPPLAGHTLTVWQENSVFLVGGFSPEDSFYTKLKEYSAVAQTWQSRAPKGIAPIGIYGHSANWHEQTNTLYVFGGYSLATQEVWSSDALHAYHEVSNTWYLLPPANVPLHHLFHSAITTSRYLFVIGGGTSEKNFTNSVYAYQYDCNTWQEVITTDDGPPVALGQTAVAIDGSIYVYGGFHSRSMGSLYSLTLPDDICKQYRNHADCNKASGCTSCEYDAEFYSCSYENSCLNFPVSAESNSAPLANHSIIQCNTSSVFFHSCTDRSTCGECLTVYPAHVTVKNDCKWCYGCPQGACIPDTANCDEYCENHQHEEIDNINKCSEVLCSLAGCKECRERRGCMWTRQFKPIAETRYRLAKKPSFSWNCYMYSLRDVSPEHIEIETSPPNPCPEPCHTHLTCTDCLDSDGADGGRSSCVWSSPLQQCMSPNYLYLHCTTGLCGLILYGSSDLCPVPCSAITHCDSCLRQVNCGWCSVGFNATEGVCLPGNISSPVNAVCRNNDVSGSTDIPADLTDLAMTAEAVWHYLTCPPENECHNGDYTCSENEQCQDTPESYICICMDGYNRNSDGVCSPVCSSTCEYGTCVAPDTCQCDFGYVGDTCSDKCNCNNHSACPGPDSLDVCTDCLHNTMGANCEYCKTFHVGNASNGEDCTPCRDICNSNSDFCISNSNDENWQSQHGPLSAVDVKCLNCTNNSQGDKCESCQEGFFWKDETSCEPCECNGHSDSCDAATGMGCTCNNHTRSPPCPSDSYAEPCYRHQCSVCTDQEVFKGNPTKGHQCYRLVEVAPRCFGINNEQSECTGGSELPPGKSTLFVIKPSFMDLDIRVTIDVTVGSIDVYITHEPDMFVIVSDGAGRHRVMIDGNKNVDRTDVIPLEESSRTRREATATEESGSVPYINKVTSHTAAGLNSFVTIDDVQFVTVIRNAENRLIVTIPHRVHDLKIKWFYFLLLATDGTTPERTDTPGALIYRQDIPEIDLFIFFSAFLSSFFKLLAILIAVWKLKVSWEARQAARARSLEMEHRRSRPFGHVVVFMEEVADPLPVQPVHPSRRTKRKSPRSRRSTPSGRSRHGPITPPPPPPTQTFHEKLPFSPGPIALEPTDDGMAAVGTVVISLPGGSKAPLQACLASGLMRQGKNNSTTQGRIGRHNSNKQGNTRLSSGRTYRPV